MAIQYLENPLLFINSTNSIVPKGRNVRTQNRTQQAGLQRPAKNQFGHFGFLDLSTKRHVLDEENRSTTKRRKAGSNPGHGSTNIESPRLGLASSPSSPSATLDPSEVLTVATFHIRRIAAMTVRAYPDRLGEALRCRQWSCVPFALERFGKSRCLDSALFCVAAKLRQITGGSASHFIVLSSYTEALQELQRALLNPGDQKHLDLLATTQLLATYEMLDSLDNATWAKHIAGAVCLAQPMGTSESNENVLTFAQAAPLFTDALLTGNDEFFRRYPWRSFRRSAHKQKLALPENSRGLISCLLELPELLSSANAPHGLNAPSRYVLLDRAHMLKNRLRSGLLQTHVQSRNDKDAFESFDKLGMCLAALVALDRLIASLRPMEPRTPEKAEDETTELCAQLLQLELGAAEAYPASDLMAAFKLSTFQQMPGFIIVLPGPND